MEVNVMQTITLTSVKPNDYKLPHFRKLKYNLISDYSTTTY